jgi:hypothetical protein
MDWLFDGLGTMLLGLAMGGSGGYYLGSRSVRQKQKAGHNATQTQVGGDQTNLGQGPG